MRCTCGLNLPVKIFPFFCSCGTKWASETASELFREFKPRPAVESHWPALHRYPVGRDWDSAAAREWYLGWCGGIPSYNCSCAANWKAYTAKNPPDFTSAQAFFEWSVESHNYVSSNHSHKPTISLTEAAGLYRVPWIVRRPRGVVTLALGEHRRVLDITLPLMRAYADRVGADLHIIDSDFRPDYPMANKWRIANFARNYDQTLYVDSDVLITPGSPDIFSAVPEGFAARDERPDYHYRPNWYSHEVLDLYQSQGVSHEPQHCPNGGVLLMTPGTCELYEEPPHKPYSQLWCTDQHWLSYRLETTDRQVTWLDDRWNWGFIRNDWWAGLAGAWFIHLNGSRPLSYRLELAERIKAGNYTKFLPPKEADWVPKHD